MGYRAPIASAQVLYGSIVGAVTDPTGALVSRAEVKVINTSTGLSREVAADDVGYYSIQNLPQGAYDLSVSATGFKPLTQKGVNVLINTVTRADLTLQVGGVTESITVDASAALLQTNKTDVNVNLEARAVGNLPLSGYRNFQSLINLVPGATPGRYQNAVIDTPQRDLTFNFNGQDRGDNNTRVDGAPNILVTMTHHMVYVPPVESVEEVNISTNNFEAELGMTGGAAVTVSTKSGTNDFHGSVFAMNTNNALRTFWWDENRAGVTRKPKSVRNIDGFSLGGPIKRNKLFFFGDWEGTFERVGRSNLYSVPADDDAPYGIFQVSLETMERRPVTRAREGMGDWRFDVSPDGKTLAFVRYGQPGLGDIYTAPLQGGEPRRVTNCNASIDGLAWTPDGREIVYDLPERSGSRLWRISADLPSPANGTRLDEPTDATSPITSRPVPGKAARLAYQVRRLDLGLHITSLRPVDSNGFPIAPKPLNHSTGDDFGGSFSPDGSQVAFSSDRSGGLDIWISNRDGSSLYRLTHTSGIGTAHAAWSPDGKTIAFQSSALGNPDLYVLAADGKPRGLTSGESRDGFPSWSRDGDWIYFMSDRSGSFQIWTVGLAGEGPVQITNRGGFEAHESPDRKFVYYLDRPPAAARGTVEPSKLMRIPVEGGHESVVIPSVWPFHWTVVKDGIYYLGLDPPSDEVLFYRFDTRQTTRVAILPRTVSRVDGRAAVSSDGRWLLTTHVERTDTDFMIIDNFR
jgi:Tol biopolymer transport system component